MVVTNVHTIVWDGEKFEVGVIGENFLLNLDISLMLFSKLKFISLKEKSMAGYVIN